MYTVNIDAGGTMTDGLVAGGGRVLGLKVDSTPHDLTVSMFELIDRAAELLGFADRRAFLDEVRIIRWSSTVTSNVLAERRGPRIGLLVDEGEERRLYGDGTSAAIDCVVPGHSVVGLEKGAAQAASVLAAVRTLLENGVRRICISLGGSFAAAEREAELKRLIADQFPEHYLGAVPVLLGTEMVQSPDDTTRAHYSAINAYVHGPLASSLFKAEDRLKAEHDWRGTFLVGHTNGGMARVGKTKAIDTIESGPVFGTHAAAFFAREYRLPALRCVDVGGTTAKVSVVRDGTPAMQRSGDFFGIPVRTPLQLLRSAALGGGSVVHCRDGAVRIGPQSMGAAPGPACYGLGGEEPTLTDCLLLLGYLDPKLFFSGRRQLSLDRAREAVARSVAAPAGLSVEQAALAARDEAIRCLATLLESVSREGGANIREAPVFAYGGNGPLLVSLAAEHLGIARVYVSFGLGPAFSAFGVAISNVVHVYERAVAAAGGAAERLQQVNGALARLLERARRDIASEGFAGDAARFSVELESGDASILDVTLAAPADGLASVPAFDQAILRLRVEVSVPRLAQQDLFPDAAPGKAAQREERSAWFGAECMRVPLYDSRELGKGDTIAGPAIVSGGNFSCVVGPASRLTVDRFGNGVIEAQKT